MIVMTSDILPGNSTLQLQKADDITQLTRKVKVAMKIHVNSQRDWIAPKKEEY